MIVFLDASALIYLVEGAEPFATRTRTELGRLVKRYGVVGTALSRLSWLECRVLPSRRNDLATLALYDRFFALPDVSWIGLSRDVVELATAIRVKYGLRTPDALQAASCLQLGPEHLFLTGDRSFSKVSGLTTRVLA